MFPIHTTNEFVEWKEKLEYLGRGFQEIVKNYVSVKNLSANNFASIYYCLLSVQYLKFYIEINVEKLKRSCMENNLFVLF